MSLVAGFLLDCNSEQRLANSSSEYRANLQRNIADTIAFLPKLTTGLDVNVRFNGIHQFEFTHETAIFDLLDMALVHGWLVDPEVRALHASPLSHPSQQTGLLTPAYWCLLTRHAAACSLLLRHDTGPCAAGCTDLPGCGGHGLQPAGGQAGGHHGGRHPQVPAGLLRPPAPQQRQLLGCRRSQACADHLLICRLSHL